MIAAGQGFRAVPSSALKHLLAAVHRDEIPCPLTADVLACVGLQDRSEVLLGCLRGLSRAGVRAVLVAVLAERRGR